MNPGALMILNPDKVSERVALRKAAALAARKGERVFVLWNAGLGTWEILDHPPVLGPFWEVPPKGADYAVRHGSFPNPRRNPEFAAITREEGGEYGAIRLKGKTVTVGGMKFILHGRRRYGFKISDPISGGAIVDAPMESLAVDKLKALIERHGGPRGFRKELESRQREVMVKVSRPNPFDSLRSLKACGPCGGRPNPSRRRFGYREMLKVARANAEYFQVPYVVFSDTSGNWRAEKLSGFSSELAPAVQGGTIVRPGESPMKRARPNPEGFYTIKAGDVGKKSIRAFGRSWPVADFIGHIGRYDVGKRVYRRGDILQVESGGQLKTRVESNPGARWHMEHADEARELRRTSGLDRDRHYFQGKEAAHLESWGSSKYRRRGNPARDLSRFSSAELLTAYNKLWRRTRQRMGGAFDAPTLRVSLPGVYDEMKALDAAYRRALLREGAPPALASEQTPRWGRRGNPEYQAKYRSLAYDRDLGAYAFQAGDIAAARDKAISEGLDRGAWGAWLTEKGKPQGEHIVLSTAHRKGNPRKRNWSKEQHALYEEEMHQAAETSRFLSRDKNLRPAFRRMERKAALEYADRAREHRFSQMPFDADKLLTHRRPNGPERAAAGFRAFHAREADKALRVKVPEGWPRKLFLVGRLHKLICSKGHVVLTGGYLAAVGQGPGKLYIINAKAAKGIPAGFRAGQVEYVPPRNSARHGATYFHPFDRPHSVKRSAPGYYIVAGQGLRLTRRGIVG